MKDQIYVTFTIFQLLVSIVNSYINKKKGIKSYLVLLIVNKSILEYYFKLKKFSFFEDIIVFDSTMFKTDVSIKDIIKKYTRYPIYYYETNDNLTKLDKLIKNCDINIFSTSHSFSLYLLKKYANENHLRLLEDGEDIYYYQPLNKKIFLFRIFYNYPFRAEKTKLVKEIIVQNPDRMPEELRSKCSQINYNQQMMSLTTAEKQSLINFFSESFNFKKNNKKNFILLTQSLSEQGIVSEEYKVELYKRIISEYGKGFDIYIKTHPRELTDYKLWFDFNFFEIPGNFPIEILNFLPLIEFERGVTLFSSAINNSNFIKEKIFLGHEWDSKLYKAVITKMWKQ